MFTERCNINAIIPSQRTLHVTKVMEYIEVSKELEMCYFSNIFLLLASNTRIYYYDNTFHSKDVTGSERHVNMRSIIVTGK